ncbi:hypothetical protein E0Z10_g3966 [Xylaria hypoxylon]|uniref:Transcription factor domain-containing protein n=1 Tax=Xylaria hypoxylon TaxID=37992 RepID=A0A4Z0Z5Z2_9PEZI|nr:hypothetical protein E0Z10_g3966 [Xylaria hypoxylon]
MADSGVWIVNTTPDKPDQSTRKLIRSHVMRGKNTRAARRAKEPIQYSEWVTHAHGQHVGMLGASEGWVPSTPRKVASELASFGFTIELKPYMVDLLYRAFTTIKPSAYTIETKIVDERPDDLFCFSNLSQHPAMIHAILFMVQTLDDSRSQVSCGDIARYHLVKTLQYLGQSLQDKSAATTKSTMAVVLSLAHSAAMLGELETTQKHMDGLYQIVSLSGGLDSLGPGSMIEHKAQRLDFGLALATGGETRFFKDDISWAPRIASRQAACRHPELGMIQPEPDSRLLNIWADLREFARAANLATQTGRRMSSAFFSQFTGSVPYRLIALRFDPLSCSELLRLCMLAFTKGVLVRIEGLGNFLTYLAHGLKDTLVAHRQLPSYEFGKLLLWALFVTAVSVYEHFDRHWIHEMLGELVQLLHLRTWTETRAVLKSFLWIDLVFDKPAERLFNDWLRDTNHHKFLSAPEAPDYT